MKNFLFKLFLLLAVTVSTSAVAQPLSDGYYRLQNAGSNRYGFVCDNTGSIDIINLTIDGGAIELWRDRDYVSDPASIVYFESKGKKTYTDGNGKSYSVDRYDFITQGTSVVQILNNNEVSVGLKDAGNSAFYVYGAASKAGIYQEKCLVDEVAKGPSDPNNSRYPAYNRGQIGLNNSGDYQKWYCHAVTASSDSYFGVRPELQANGRYYQSFYASFPFKAYSSGVKAYTVSKVDKAQGIAVISEIQGDVPAKMPVIIETASATPSNNRLDLLASTSNSVGPNALGGVFFCNTERSNFTPYNAGTMRLLSVNAQGKLVFATASVANLPANQAFLQVDADAPAELLVMTEEEYNAAANVAVSSITLNASSKTLEIGETLQLTATVNPDNASDKSLTWSSSNPSVATVSADGLVTAQSEGSATIKATANDGSGVSASCSITVKKPIVLVASIVLNQTSATLLTGETVQLEATVNPEDATDASLTWTSSKPSVAKVDSNGLVTALAAGTAVITAKANDGSGKKATCSITVENPVVLVAAVELNMTEATILTGETVQLTAVVTPSDATDASLTWSSSDETIATVDENGLVTALAAGTAVITATTNDGSEVSASCTLTVTSVIIDIDEEETTITVEEGEEIDLDVILPEGMEDEDLTWTSSDESIVIVNEDGTLTAVGSGTVTITVTASDGSSYSVTITVEVSSGIAGIAMDASNSAAVYTVAGVKVRNAGESLAGLPAGIYVVAGKKVIVY